MMVNIVFSALFLLKKKLISERYVITLCTGIGFVGLFLFDTLKILIFCDIRKKSYALRSTVFNMGNFNNESTLKSQYF